MDREELLDRLRGIEWDDFEVKEAAWAVPVDAYKTVSAFANTSGGWLVLGVRQQGRDFVATGVTDPERLQNDFLTTCRSPAKFSWPVDVRPKLYTMDGAQILAFYIPPAARFDKPVRVRVQKSWETYIRIASGDHRCSEEEEARFLRDASRETFDSTPCPGATFSDVDLRSLKWMRGLIGERNPERAHPDLAPEDYLGEVGLLSSGGELTHGAVILFGTDKAIARIKPGGLVDFRLLNAPASAEVDERRWDDRELCEGNLVSSLRSLIERFMRLSVQPFALDPASFRSRADSPDYRALREALVNLLVHQDYSDRHRTATIRYYADRVIFENPGDSFVGLAEMLDGGSSNLRNPMLVRLLRQAGFAEQAGTGIPAIVRAWRTAERVPPEIVNDPGRKQFRLILQWQALIVPHAEQWRSRLGASISPDAARVLALGHEWGAVDRTSARLATGLSVSKVATMLSELVTQQLLLPAEDSAEDVYRIAPHILALWDEIETVNEPVSHIERTEKPSAEERVLTLLQETPGLRVPQIAARLEWSVATVKRTLGRLRAGGHIEFRGAPKTGGYFTVVS